MDENFTEISGVKVGNRVCQKVLPLIQNLQNEQVQSVEKYLAVQKNHCPVNESVA